MPRWRASSPARIGYCSVRDRRSRWRGFCPSCHRQLGWPVELTDYSAVAEAAASIERLDVLVHNAGIADLGTIAESSVQQWRDTFEANVIAVAELTRVRVDSPWPP